MKKIKKDAIIHYERMINWAKEDTGKMILKEAEMELHINDSWYLGNCSYCNRYYKEGGYENGIWYKGHCRNIKKEGCPLSSDYKDIDKCCNGLWKKMNNAKTWETWVKRAEKVLEYIKENG